MQDMSKDGLILAVDMDTEKCKTCMMTKITEKPFQNVKRETEVLELFYSDLCDLHATPFLRNKKYFVTFIDNALRFCYVYLLHSKDEALDKFKVFKTEVELEQGSLIKRFRTNKGDMLSLMRIDSLQSIDQVSGFQMELETLGLVVPEEVTKEVVQQPKPELRKSKRNRTPKDFGPEFQLYLIEGTRDEVSDQHSYCFNVEDDPKTFDEAIKSQDVAFWKEAVNDEMDSIMGNNTWVLADLPPGLKKKSGIEYFDTYAPMAHISTIRLLIAMTSIHNLIIHQMDMKTTFLNGELEEEQAPKQWHQKFDKVVLSNGYLLNQADKFQVDLTKEFLSSRFSMKDIWDADVILVSTPMDTSEKLMPNMARLHLNLSNLGYTSNPSTKHRQAIQRVLKYLKKTMEYRLTYTGYPSVLEGYTDASWINNTEDNSSTSGWVFLLGNGVISWAFKKQTCITGSTMEYEFVALAAAGKEAEWLKNLLLEISFWVKPIAPISIRYDSAATLAKAYSQMYNEKSRHLGDHLTKGLARDLVIKSAERIRLKSN
ncbi:zinc finger, CCHC-type containing protein [Tanacetum coccineum]